MDYPNSGALWPNKRRDSDKHPNVQGNIKVERSLLKAMMAETDDELIEVALSGWTREYQGDKFISLKASKPYKKGEKKEEQKQASLPVDDDQDIPF
jgi:hypothetical protein